MNFVTTNSIILKIALYSITNSLTRRYYIIWFLISFSKTLYTLFSWFIMELSFISLFSNLIPFWIIYWIFDFCLKQVVSCFTSMCFKMLVLFSSLFWFNMFKERLLKSVFGFFSCFGQDFLQKKKKERKAKD